ncbi:hypothetical protein PR048_029859 [Dryococelus australis]|uniref:Uncharacterized protein n=1 Tax=Dryococelus australis TaxID=614101 RepID=A0ABQ9G7B6_9NEOP|nr:hypothetical protein PR048_029859 [Dryococelus australis]
MLLNVEDGFPSSSELGENKNEQFYQSDSDIFMCKLCNRHLEWKNKDDSQQAAKKTFLSKTDEEHKAIKCQAAVPSVYVSGSGDLLSGSAHRKDCVPPLGENMKLKVKAAINDQSIVIVAN